MLRHLRSLNHPLPALLLAAWLGSSCGAIQFVPSPYSPQQVQLVYSKQEKVTLIRWRIGASPDDSPRFELLDADNNYQPIVFGKSVFPGGVTPCADGKGSCAQYVVRGQYRVAADAHPVRAIHGTYGLFPGAVAIPSEIPTTLSITAYFGPQNHQVYVKMDDRVASDGPFRFPRAYQRAMWPSSGLCLTDVVPMGVDLVAMNALNFDPPLPLSDLGAYCVGVKPVPGDSPPEATVAQSRALTVPVFVNGVHEYKPPVETAPLMYRIVFDLLLPIDLPDYQPCPAAKQTVEETIDRYMQQIAAPQLKQPTVYLDGGNCHQKVDRQLDVVEMGSRFQTEILKRTEREHRPIVFYFNNIDLPLPDNLLLSFQSLTDTVNNTAGHNVQLWSWFWGTPLAASGNPNVSFGWYPETSWMSPDDKMAMEIRLKTMVRDELPLMTELHDPWKPVALLSTADVTRYDGTARIKICDSSPTVLPATMSGMSYAGYASWPILATDPPGYTVYLDPEIAVPKPTFINHTVTVRYQVCTRYCSDHPYVDEAKEGQQSWAIDLTCAAEGT